MGDFDFAILKCKFGQHCIAIKQVLHSLKCSRSIPDERAINPSGNLALNRSLEWLCLQCKIQYTLNKKNNGGMTKVYLLYIQHGNILNGGCLQNKNSSLTCIGPQHDGQVIYQFWSEILPECCASCRFSRQRAGRTGGGWCIKCCSICPHWKSPFL